MQIIRHIIRLIFPNSRFAKLPSPAIDWKIWKALYSHGSLFGRHTFDILMLLWPLKMLSFNFCNVLDWTMVDLPDTMVDLVDNVVVLPDTKV